MYREFASANALLSWRALLTDVGIEADACINQTASAQQNVQARGAVGERIS